MAGLTTQLDTINTGKGIIAPNAVPATQNLWSALGEVSKTAADGLQEAGNLMDRLERQGGEKARLQMEQAKFGQEQGDRAAQNEFSTGLPAVFQVPASAMQGLNDVAKLKYGEINKGLPAGTADVRMEAWINQVAADHPENTQAIYSAAKNLGFDHYLFRDAQVQQQSEDSAVKDTLQSNTDAISAATRHGLYDPSKSYADNVTVGRQVLKAETDLQTSKTQYEIATAKQNLTKAEYDQAQDQSDRDGGNALQNLVDTNVGALYQRATVLAQGALTDPTKSATLEHDLMPQLQAAAQVAKSSIISMGHQNHLSDAKIDEMSKQIDSYTSSFNDLFTGPSSQYQQAQRAFSNMQSTFGLSVGQNMRAWSTMSAALGKNGAIGAFGGDMSAYLPKDVMDQVKAEFKGFKTSDAQAGVVHLANVAQIIKGTKGLQDFDEKTATKMLPTLVGVMKGNQDAILMHGDTTPGAQGAWQHTYGQVVNAAVTISPGLATTRNVEQATVLVASKESRIILGKMMADPNQQETAQALLVSKRATDQKLLADVQSIPSPQGYNFNKMTYDSAAGTFKATFDAAKYKAYVGTRLDPNDPHVISEAQARKAVDPDLQRRVNSANGLLNDLTETSKYDQELPQGATPLSLRGHYAQGLTLANAKGQPINPDKEFADSVTGIKKDAANMANSFATSPSTKIQAPSGEQHYGSIIDHVAGEKNVPPVAARLIVGRESSFNPSANAHTTHPESHAVGLMQLQPATARERGLYVPDSKSAEPGPGDERLNPVRNLEGGLGYFADLVKKHGGNVAAAAKEYSGGQWDAGFVQKLERAYEASAHVG